MRCFTRKTALLLGSAGLVAVAALGIDGTHATPPPPPFNLSALVSAPQASDEAMSMLAPAARYVEDVGDARVLGESGGTTWYIARGKDAGFCLLSTDDGYSGTCTLGDEPYAGGIWAVRGVADGAQAVTVLVPDGYSRVAVVDGEARRVSDVENNIAFLVHDDDVTIELTGEGLPGLRHLIRNHGDRIGQ